MESLSLRKPSEILALPFDDSDYYLQNGIFSKGNPLTIVGPSGVGKTTLLLQLAACVLTGIDFIGMPVNQQEVRWLFVQNENSNRRFAYEFSKLKLWLIADQWKLVDANITVTTLEQECDYFLSLSDPLNGDLISTAIRKVKPDVVSFDPLSAFGVGSLNTDLAMLKTLRGLASMARENNPKATPIVLHHSLQGKAGMKKAIGVERGSYGRGSDALHGWTRGQINLSPLVTEGNNSLLVVCGKNSNAPEFHPFAITRNPKTSIYEVDENIDIDGLVAESETPNESTHKPTVETVTAFVAGLPVTKAELVAAIMDEYGCKKSRAYEVIAAAENAKTIRRNARGLYVLPTDATA